MSFSRSRPRFQLMNPITRLSRKSAKPGMGAGLRCGSVMCAMVKLIVSVPSAGASEAKAIDRTAIRLLERKDNSGLGPELPSYGRIGWRKAEAAFVALELPRRAADDAWRARDCDQSRR